MASPSSAWGVPGRRAVAGYAGWAASVLLGSLALGCPQGNPEAIAFNRSLVESGSRLMEAARPFGKSFAPALLEEVDPDQVRATYESMAELVKAEHLAAKSLVVPELPGAQQLYSAYLAFVEREVTLLDTTHAEIVELVGDQRKLPVEVVIRIHSLIDEAAEEEDRLLAELHRLQDEFLRQNRAS